MDRIYSRRALFWNVHHRLHSVGGVDTEGGRMVTEATIAQGSVSILSRFATFRCQRRGHPRRRTCMYRNVANSTNTPAERNARLGMMTPRNWAFFSVCPDISQTRLAIHQSRVVIGQGQSKRWHPISPSSPGREQSGPAKWLVTPRRLRAGASSDCRVSHGSAPSQLKNDGE